MMGEGGGNVAEDIPEGAEKANHQGPGGKGREKVCTSRLSPFTCTPSALSPLDGAPTFRAELCPQLLSHLPIISGTTLTDTASRVLFLISASKSNLFDHQGQILDGW
jgi:hypothetical protein